MISEPLGGAHRDFDQAAKNIKEVLLNELKELTTLDKDSLIDKRYQKMLAYGAFTEN